MRRRRRYLEPVVTAVDALLRFGGFPEPLLQQDERELRIWQRDRVARLVRDDLRDLKHVREVSLVEQLVDLLPHRVGSPLSVECKSGERGVSPAIRYCAERTSIPRFFQVHLGDRHFETGVTTVLPFRTVCRELNLP